MRDRGRQTEIERQSQRQRQADRQRQTGREGRERRGWGGGEGAEWVKKGR